MELGCQGEVKSCGMQKGFNRQPRGQQPPSNPNIIYLPGKGGLKRLLGPIFSSGCRGLAAFPVGHLSVCLCIHLSNP